MARKTKKEIENEYEYIKKYRWEFTRRNSEYQRDFKEFGGCFKKFTPLKNLREMRKRQPLIYTKLKNMERKAKDNDKEIKRLVCGKWSLLSFVDPSISYDKYKRKSLNEQNPAIMFPFAGLVGTHISRPVPALLLESHQYGQNPEILRITVFLSFRKDQILNTVENIIDKAKKEYKKLSPENINTKKRFDSYDKYLKIYDLRKKGKTFKEIAGIIYSNAELEEDGLEVVTRRVKNGYDTCVELIKNLV